MSFNEICLDPNPKLHIFRTEVLSIRILYNLISFVIGQSWHKVAMGPTTTPTVAGGAATPAATSSAADGARLPLPLPSLNPSSPTPESHHLQAMLPILDSNGIGVGRPGHDGRGRSHGGRLRPSLPSFPSALPLLRRWCLAPPPSPPRPPSSRKPMMGRYRRRRPRRQLLPVQAGPGRPDLWPTAVMKPSRDSSRPRQRRRSRRKSVQRG